jgi:hypothetical protein
LEEEEETGGGNVREEKQMSNDKAQSPNEYQMRKPDFLTIFWILSIWALFGIWILAFDIIAGMTEHCQ